MTPGDLLVVLGLNGRVAALLRKDGRILWSTDLPGVLGERFVTVTCDETHVYAYTHGQIHCLDMESGRVLWHNELKVLVTALPQSVCQVRPPIAPQPRKREQIPTEVGRVPTHPFLELCELAGMAG